MKWIFILLLFSLQAGAQQKVLSKGKFSAREVTLTRMELKKGQTVSFSGDVYVMVVSSNNKANTVEVTHADKKVKKGKGMYVQFIPLEVRSMTGQAGGTPMRKPREERNFYNKNSPTRKIKVSQKATVLFYTVTSKR